MQASETEKIESSPRRLLVVGDMVNAVSCPAGSENVSVKQVPDMLEAITLAARGGFDDVFVVMSCFEGRLESALETLARVGQGCKVYLLAQMHEEPRARQIVSRKETGAKLADEYFISPLDLGEMFGSGLQGETISEKKKEMLRPDWKDRRIRELERLATRDDLTGLKNRRYVMEFLHQILQYSGDRELSVTVLIFDIDNFKKYNDNFGHLVGDNVIKQVAVMMKRCCREHDLIGRIGGDEFAVVFWDLPSDSRVKLNPESEGAERRSSRSKHPREAMAIAERFRKEVISAELSFLGPEGKGVLTISGGLATYPKDGQTVEELFDKADQGLLEAKKKGKNQMLIFGPGEDEEDLE